MYSEHSGHVKFYAIGALHIVEAISMGGNTLRGYVSYQRIFSTLHWR